MRYFAKFHDGCQTKNKAQVQAYAFMKTFASTLLNNDAAFQKMVSKMNLGIDLVNYNHTRCGDISFSTYLHEDYRGNSVNVGDICSYSFYPVLSDFVVHEKETKQETEELSANTSKIFTL